MQVPLLFEIYSAFLNPKFQPKKLIRKFTPDLFVMLVDWVSVPG
jgi:hypothetical protein